MVYHDVNTILLKIYKAKPQIKFKNLNKLLHIAVTLY